MKTQPPPFPAEVGRRIVDELARSELVIRYTRHFGEFAGASVELRASDTFPLGFERGVPVRIDESVIGFLVIDTLFPNSRLKGRRRTLAVHLLDVFAEHLSLLAGGMVLRTSQSEPAAVTRARSFIDEHQSGKLSLSSVAAAARLSAVHFCRTFKRATGFGFSDYVARLRIEHAKGLLANRGMRVNEVAFAVGFGSVPHFNRVFKRLVGKSPSEYREARAEQSQ
ncbi:MAG TPA: AraC family transcriptional regulator [Chthoniobacteraceae bacterium]|jgi:AraC-like DNA-binding protein